MSDKKINLIGKWNMGRLTRLPRQNVRQTLKKKREIFIEELNVLNNVPYGNWLSLIRTLYFKE